MGEKSSGNLRPKSAFAGAPSMHTISEMAHATHDATSSNNTGAYTGDIGVEKGSLGALTRVLSSRGSLSVADGWDKGFVFKVEDTAIKVR